MQADRAIELIVAEYGRAVRTLDPFHSAHEGYAVIEEEFDELKDEVWKKKAERDGAAMIKEASHVAAMALRFLVDIC